MIDIITFIGCPANIEANTDASNSLIILLFKTFRLWTVNPLRNLSLRSELKVRPMSYAFCFYFFALLEKTYRSLKSAKKYPLTANRLANSAKSWSWMSKV
jgi:hypothetical protein